MAHKARSELRISSTRMSQGRHAFGRASKVFEAVQGIETRWSTESGPDRGDPSVPAGELRALKSTPKTVRKGEHGVKGRTPSRRWEMGEPI